MLPPLGEDETEDDRKNLSLRSKFSSVYAEIWLLGSPGDSVISAHKPRRTTIALNSDHGSIHAQVVCPFIYPFFSRPHEPDVVSLLEHSRRRSTIFTEGDRLPRCDPTGLATFLPGPLISLHAPRGYLCQRPTRSERNPAEPSGHHTAVLYWRFPIAGGRRMARRSGRGRCGAWAHSGQVY